VNRTLHKHPRQSERDRKIARLREAPSGSRERIIYEQFELAKRSAKASSVFCRGSGRFPFIGKGDVNTYALFAELFFQVIVPHKAAGIIVPAGIAFDDNNGNFFRHVVDTAKLLSLYSFYEIRRSFKDTDDRKPFCILTLGENSSIPEFAFDIRLLSELGLHKRRFSLSRDQMARINPNTKTGPVFRSRADAALTEKLYERVPILIMKQLTRTEIHGESRSSECSIWILTAHCS
jgi:hypothetical protein